MPHATPFTLAVNPKIPQRLARLEELANDLWYSWDRSTRSLFSRLHPGLCIFHCSPAASVNPDGSHTVGAVTATASFRFAKWLDGWFQLSGCNIIIGKGGMTSEVYRNSFVPNQAIYLTTVGYGTGALLGRGIKRVAGVYWLEELGLAQAVWVLDVEKFGPFLVESDLAGNSLFERENAKIAPGLEKLYAGTRPATLRRYGETDDKTEEVI